VVDVCPKCGDLGYIVVEPRGRDRYRREYVFMVHIKERAGKKRKIRKCYLGPVDKYKYVDRVHGLFALTNLVDQDYLEVVKSAVDKYVERAKTTATRYGGEKARILLLEASRRLARFSEILAKIARELEREAEMYREMGDRGELPANNTVQGA
jgi:hypothetical protein